MYKNIFIDLDNTLWDFQTNSKNVLSVLFFKYGLDKYFKDFDEYFKIYSGHNDYLWEQYALNKINKDELNKDEFSTNLVVLTEKEQILVNTLSKHDTLTQ